MKRSLPLICAFLVIPSAAVLEAQVISSDKTSLSFVAQVGGPALTQTINITSTATPIGFILSPNTQWLKTNPQSGTTPSAVTVTADPAGLAPAVYNATLTILSSGGTIPIAVTMNVSPIGVTPQSLDFSYSSGAALPAAQNLTFSGVTTTYTAAAATASGGNWLQAAPSAGTSPGGATVLLNSAVVNSGMAPGKYSGTVTITPTSGTATTPIAIPVTLTVAAASPVTVNPATINLNYQNNGVNPQGPQTITLATTGNTAVGYSLQASVDPNPSGRIWIVANPATGGSIPASSSSTATIGYDSTANLAPGSYNGKVTVLTPGGSPAQQDIAVKLLVANQPLLNVPNATLAFNYQIGGPIPAPKTVTATSTAVAANATTGQLPLVTIVNTNGTGNWLSVPTQTAVTGTPFSVAVDPAGLAPGTYTGSVTVSSSGAANPPQQIPVTLTVSNDPQIVATVNGCSTLTQTCPMIFAYQPSQLLPAQQTIQISSSTGATLNYTAAGSSTDCGGNWLVLGGTTTGTTGGTVSVAINPAGIAAGTQCKGSIALSAINPATGAATPNSPVTIPVTLYLSNTPLLTVNPLALSFTAQVGGQGPQPQSLTIGTSSTTEALNYTVAFATTSGGNGWLIGGPLSGTTLPGSNTVTVSVLPGLLSPGSYNGTVTVTATTQSGGAVADSPITVPVSFTVTPGNLTVTPANLSFTYTLGAASPQAKQLTIGTTGQQLNFTATVSTQDGAAWLSASPANGATPGTVNVSIDGSKFTAAGTYNGAVTITSSTAFAGNSPAVVPVSVQVGAGTLTVTPDTLTFNQVAGGQAPASQTLNITAAPGALSFNAAAGTDSGGNWLSVTPASGTTPGSVTVSVNAGTLTVGQYTGTVTITVPGGAQGSPKAVRVALNVVSPQSITVSPATLNFNYTTGLAAPAAQTLNVTASGGTAAITAAASTTSGGNWLAVTPATGNTPAALSITVTPQTLAAGNYTGKITIDSANSASHPAATVTVNLTVTTVPKPLLNAVQNAASYATGSIAPGENIVLYGTGIGPADLVKGRLTSGGTLDSKVGDTRVLFDGVPAPILYASANQTSVMVPYGVGGRTSTNVVVEYLGVQSNAVPYTVTAAAPGIYTLNQAGNGPGAVLNQDYSVNSASNPAAKGSVIQVYMTGEGATLPASSDGGITPVNGSGLNKPILPVTATVGGVPANLQYWGSAPGIVYGVMQVNVIVPAGAPSGGSVAIAISVGGVSSQRDVTVAIQ